MLPWILMFFDSTSRYIFADKEFDCATTRYLVSLVTGCLVFHDKKDATNDTVVF